MFAVDEAMFNVCVACIEASVWYVCFIIQGLQGINNEEIFIKVENGCSSYKPQSHAVTGARYIEVVARQ